MTRARHVTPSRTAERLERMRILITALQASQLRQDEIGALLHLSPSGVRKYLNELGGKVDRAWDAGEQVYRLAMNADETKTYLGQLDARTETAPARPTSTAMSRAMLDKSRHFHIMQDDEPFSVKPARGIPNHEPVMAHFFNLVPAGVWA